MSAEGTSSANRRIGEDKLERILTQLTELTAEVKHLNQRMDSRSAEIGKLTERVGALEVRLAVNDRQTDKNSSWFDYVFKGILTVLIGYVALRLGLK